MIQYNQISGSFNIIKAMRGKYYFKWQGRKCLGGEVFSAIIKVQESSNISNFIGVGRFKQGKP